MKHVTTDWNVEININLTIWEREKMSFLVNLNIGPRPAAIRGTLTEVSGAGQNSKACLVDSTVVGTIYSGDAVSLVSTSTGGIPQIAKYVEGATAPYGFCSMDGVNVSFVAGDRCQVAQTGSIMFCESGTALNAGVDVSYDVESGTIVTPAIATSAQWKSADLSLNVANFKAVDNGELALKKGSDAQVAITGLDFTGKKTLAQIAAVIQAGITAATAPYTIMVDAIGNRLIITATTAGSSGSFAVEAVSGGTGTSILGATYLNNAAATQIAGTTSGAVCGKSYEAVSGSGLMFRVKLN